MQPVQRELITTQHCMIRTVMITSRFSTEYVHMMILRKQAWSLYALERKTNLFRSLIQVIHKINMTSKDWCTYQKSEVSS